jgi:hypothetical protein
MFGEEGMDIRAAEVGKVSRYIPGGPIRSVVLRIPTLPVGNSDDQEAHVYRAERTGV